MVKNIKNLAKNEEKPRSICLKLVSPRHFLNPVFEYSIRDLILIIFLNIIIYHYFVYVVTDLDTNENDNNQHNLMGNAKWWDTLSTMTEAKIALQYLFEKAADNMATLSNSKTQNKACINSFFFEEFFSKFS